MKRRVDNITRLLELWAEWRVFYECYPGTGNSPLARFTDPCGLPVYGSIPLWRGRMHDELAQLNSRLAVALGTRKLWPLLALYGLPGDSESKTIALGYSRTTLRRLKQTARRVVAGYLHHKEKPHDGQTELRASA